MSEYLRRLERMRIKRENMNNMELNPEGKDIFDKLKNAKTIPELDSLRIEVAKEMQSDGQDYFNKVQKAFITAKRRIARTR